MRQESARSTEQRESAPEELSPLAQMEEIFQRFMKLTGKISSMNAFGLGQLWLSKSVTNHEHYQPVLVSEAIGITARLAHGRKYDMVIILRSGVK